ncbi:hypothetical protein J7U46_08820 [Pelomonas sp. V22]|uniref:hypothetical protein n=1 Tax=Pelomonas sp. V22 TaxID=2822139 RepID=UPI0024A904BE|nr:hypothetical protein [Pelomonas sp. V22]MDI4633146.1 hypothetical protein [Pelomonas sp. V22]
MALTPVVFFELATPAVAIPCPDPYFLAVRLTKRFVEKLVTLAAMCREHKLATIVFKGQGQPVEFIDTGLLNPSAELHVVGSLLLISVWGQQWNERGEPGKADHIADSWFIDIDSLAQIYEAGTPVTLHPWDDWDDPDIDLEPFGVRVFGSLCSTGSLPRYQRREWFDPEWVAMLEELGRPGVKRVRHPPHQRGG